MRVQNLLKPAVSILIAFILLIISCEKPERFVKIKTVEEAVEISYTTVTLKGEILDLGSKPIDDHGILVSTSTNPRLENSIFESLGSISSKGLFEVTISGLSKNTLYYFRAFVTVDGTDIFSEQTFSFRTKDTETATVSTGVISGITMTSATSSGNVTSDGGEAVIKRGLCWATSASPTLSACMDTTVNGSGTGSFNATLADLAPGTKYYVRAYAVNAKGTSYSPADSIFTTHNLPQVSTSIVTNVTNSGATAGGSIINEGGVSVTARGVVWGTSENPTIALSTKTTDGTGPGAFVSNITGLTPGTSYYVRAYATNIYGTSYGNEIQVTATKPSAVSTLAATLVGNTTATLNGSVNPNNFSSTVTFEYGKDTSYGIAVDADPKTVTGQSSVSVSATLSGLDQGTVYHYRVLSANAGGSSSGEDMTFTTTRPPEANTLAATQVTSTGATLNGTVNANGFEAAVSFEYGTSVSYGSTKQASPQNVTGNTITSINCILTGLTPGATYHYRIMATNTGGISTGTDQTFVAVEQPVAVTGSASSVGSVAATLSGSVNAKNLSTAVTFEYGTTTSYGQTAAATESPVTGPSNVSVSASILSLEASTTYHFRVKAVSAGGTVYGDDATFTTSEASSNTVVDFDGNVYNTVNIGSQVWMQENLKTTSFNNGDPIQNTTDNTAWQNIVEPAYSWYDNSTVDRDIYGGLYNWYAVQDVRNLCPAGWHVPTKTEITYLNLQTSCGLKETGTVHWTIYDPCANNTSGFTALPGGSRFNGVFNSKGNSFQIWSSTDEGTNPWYMGISGTSGIGYAVATPSTGFSVRCLKGTMPILKTGPATATNSVSATLTGTVNPNTASTIVTFEYGTTTSYGNEISAEQNPLSGNLPVNVSAILPGLLSNTTYHFRVKAVNAGGTSYGSDMTFTTTETVADIEGNIYNTVQIGSQLWMQENLRTSKFIDGSTIPFIVFASQWSSLYTPAIGTINTDTYGFLYNWYSVETGKLCPIGWHVPTDMEWTTLTTFLGDESVAGGKLKETGTSHWLGPNTGATNVTSFTGLPGGERHASGVYSDTGYYGYWWSSTSYDATRSWDRCMIYNDIKLLRYYSGNQEGHSVRCIKD